MSNPGLRSYRFALTAAGLLLLALLLCIPPAAAGQADATAAPIVNDEGGPVTVSGLVTYTNPFFTLGVAEPLLILEDQAGFVDRNRRFIFPPESQVIGQITSDFNTSPFSYSLALPIEPQGSLRDVDQDGASDLGVMVFAVAYWTNIFGGPQLEERDLLGGGWSTAYASTRASSDADRPGEIVGGRLIVFAPDDQQGFPSGFGGDGLLFTADDPIVRLPAGYTLVDLDHEPFTFDRSRRPIVPLIEPERGALVDLSALSYTEAFAALVDKLRKEYAFTEFKAIDWDALEAQFRPRFERAEARKNAQLYRRALRDFALAIPDGHVSGPQPTSDDAEATAGSIGLTLRDLDDGRTIVSGLAAGGPADRGGIALGAEIIAVDGIPVDDFVDAVVPLSGPHSAPHVRRMEQLRYAVRSPIGTPVTVTVRSAAGAEMETVTLVSTPDLAGFDALAFGPPLDGLELPLAYRLLESGYIYAVLYSFSDNELLTVQLWERLLRKLDEEMSPGLVIDLRQNGGGSGFLADQMAAYFFQEPLPLGYIGYYDHKRDAFFFDTERADHLILPSEELRYDGPLALLVGPECASACEFFAYNLTLQERAAIVGQYPTAGLGGSINVVLMPENEYFQYTAGRAVDMKRQIHIEGRGIAPTVRVPVNEATLVSGADPVLDAAVDYLDRSLVERIDGGRLSLDMPVEGRLRPGKRVEYSLEAAAGELPSLSLRGSGALDMVLRLRNEEGGLLAEESGVSPAIVGWSVPEAMTLVVEVATADDAGRGAYTLWATKGASAESGGPAFAPEAAAIGEATVRTAGWRLSVRDGPSLDALRLGYVENGSVHPLLELSADGRWARIAVPALGAGVTGWVSADFVVVQ